MDTNMRPSSSGHSGDNPCNCVVCNLLKKGFSRLSFQKQCDIISSGRHMPSIKLETKVKNFTRYFNMNFFDKYTWLTGCKTLSKLFCWPCLLFNTTENTVWNSSGFSDLNNFHKNIKRHVNNKAHLISIIKEKTFGLARIEHCLDDKTQISDRIHNELVKKNREILKRLIDVTCFLGEHELTFRGRGQEGRESINRENYMDLIELIGKYDETLKNNLNDSTVFRGPSNKIQNDLIKCITHVVLASFKDEIKNAPFVSIVLDETTDITNLSQLALVVRYVKSNGSLQERFLGFLDITTDRTADVMYNTVCDIVENLQCGLKLIAQSYDGAVVMSAHFESLQAKVKETFQNAIFVHYCTHRLNLVLSQALGFIKDCKVFFSTLSGMAAFFSKSSKRTHALDIQVAKRFPKVSSIWWNYNGQLVQTVSRYREALIELFQDILDKKEQWDAETVNSSRGYLQLLKNDFNFYFLLNVFAEIFPYTDILFDVLQTKSNDIGFCVQKINDFKRQLTQKREQFQYFWHKTIDFHDRELQNKRIKVEEDVVQASYHQLFLDILDNITQQLHTRFQNFNDLKFVELCNFSNYNSHFPEQPFNSLKANYGNLFDIVALRSQLSVLYEMPTVNMQKTPSNMLIFLKESGLDNAYCEVVKLSQLVLTIPLTSDSVEHSFSVLNRVKDFVRNATCEEKLSSLAVLPIEKDYVKELSQNSKFYDDVIEEFAKVDRRITLLYK